MNYKALEKKQINCSAHLEASQLVQTLLWYIYPTELFHAPRGFSGRGVKKVTVSH